VVAALARADLLLLSGTSEPFEVVPAGDLGSLHISDLLRALRHSTHEPNAPSRLERELNAPLAAVVDALERQTEDSAQNLSFHELGLLTRREADGPEASSAPQPETRPPSSRNH
jgi:hypothetical protein